MWKFHDAVPIVADAVEVAVDAVVDAAVADGAGIDVDDVIGGGVATVSEARECHER